MNISTPNRVQFGLLEVVPASLELKPSAISSIRILPTQTPAEAVARHFDAPFQQYGQTLVGLAGPAIQPAYGKDVFVPLGADDDSTLLSERVTKEISAPQRHADQRAIKATVDTVLDRMVNVTPSETPSDAQFGEAPLRHWLYGLRQSGALKQFMDNAQLSTHSDGSWVLSA